MDDEEDTENEETEIEIDHLSPPQLLSLSKSESKKVEKTVVKSEKITKKDVEEVVNEVEEVGDEELLGKKYFIDLFEFLFIYVHIFLFVY